MRIVGSEDKAKEGCLYIRCQGNCFGIGATNARSRFEYLSLRYRGRTMAWSSYSEGVGYYTLELDEQETEEFINCMMKFFESRMEEL